MVFIYMYGFYPLLIVVLVGRCQSADVFVSNLLLNWKELAIPSTLSRTISSRRVECHQL